ncbi:ArgS-related anticodon-binding protein NrtL [Streptomyces sp. NPDC006283]|uniref:ArgS-related anticodon-binding protein NrtL n=1 Tax=Streptomyces sp. NPDC006283 TaxID=3156741 RepID=UPI0033A37E01
MTPAELSRTVRHAVCRAVEDGALRVDVPAAEGVKIERPRPGGCGDYATGVALRLARQAGRPAAEVAEAIRQRIAGDHGIAHVEVTGPGFLNFTLHSSAQEQLVRRVLDEGARYGAPRRSAGGGSFPHADEERARVWADTLARLGAEPGPGESVRVVPVGDQNVVRRLGPDAARWALLAAAAHDRPRTDAGLLVQHERNPLHQVRYAHSRAKALTRNAERLGFRSVPGPHVDAPALTAAVGDHPAVVADAARLRAPDRLVRHLEVTAEALLSFQHTVLPVGDEKPSAAHRSRLALAEAAGTVLAGGLSLLGISAPEHL